MAENELEQTDDQSPNSGDNQDGKLPSTNPDDNQDNNDGWADGEKVIEDGNLDYHDGGFHGSYKIVAMNKASLSMGSNIDVTLGFKSMSTIGAQFALAAGGKADVNLLGKAEINAAKEFNYTTLSQKVKMIANRAGSYEVQAIASANKATASDFDTSFNRINTDGVSVSNSGQELSSVGSEVTSKGMSNEMIANKIAMINTKMETLTTEMKTLTSQVETCMNLVSTGANKSSSYSIDMKM